MDDKNYWKLFETSGHIDDYMNFKHDDTPSEVENREDGACADNDNGAGFARDEDGRK